ncbi:conserved exported protein of unknown function [Methylocella tundrae]|uniref:Uncharacterized protein n=2 Tax=Methylocella tundrae TaxID=227605 RepID=A0A4U8YX25_METTU|nr:conserved exported protein of unknown function [Methylocella tundrae]
MRLKLLAAAAFLALTPKPVSADSDKLPLTFSSITSDFKKAFSKVESQHYSLNKVRCEDGSEDKRTVCTYKLGNFMIVMAETEKGGSEIVGLTMICTTSNDIDAAKCIISYEAAIFAAGTDEDIEHQSEIISVLFKGLKVGESITIKTAERRYILQKSAGLWFHIYAADAPD